MPCGTGWLHLGWLGYEGKGARWVQRVNILWQYCYREESHHIPSTIQNRTIKRALTLGSPMPALAVTA